MRKGKFRKRSFGKSNSNGLVTSSAKGGRTAGRPHRRNGRRGDMELIRLSNRKRGKRSGEKEWMARVISCRGIF